MGESKGSEAQGEFRLRVGLWLAQGACAALLIMLQGMAGGCQPIMWEEGKVDVGWGGGLDLECCTDHCNSCTADLGVSHKLPTPDTVPAQEKYGGRIR